MITPVPTIAAIELPHRHGDVAGQLARLARVLQALGPVDAALLPEAALTGYLSPAGDFDLSRFAEPLAGATVERLRELARAHRLTLVAPLIERGADREPTRDGDRAGRRLWNAMVALAADGELVAHYRKRHPWYPETWATAGDLGTPTVDLAGRRFAIAVCFDLHFLAGDAGPALDGADGLLFASAWVDDPPNVDARGPLLGALARRHHLAIVNANWGPGDPRISGQGGSRILDRAGRPVGVEREVDGVRVVVADLD